MARTPLQPVAAPPRMVVEISSDDSSSDYSSSDDSSAIWEEAEANRIIMRRGPKSKGRESFDKCCVYGNMVDLNKRQVQFLRELAHSRPSQKVFVSTMKLAHTESPKAKMYFPRKYTNANIKKYMALPAQMRVYCQDPEPLVVTIIMGKGRKSGAQITSGWYKVVDATAMSSCSGSRAAGGTD